jgi:hypothetical protein
MATTLLCFAVFGAEVSGSGTWWTIFSCCTTAIVAQFVYIKKIVSDLKTCQEARISSLEEKVRMAQAAKNPDSPPNPRIP